MWRSELWADALVLNNERGFFWLPVAFAFGAGITCSIRADDQALVWVGVTFGCLLLWLASLSLSFRATQAKTARISNICAAALMMTAAFSGGGAAGLLRAQAVAAPVMADSKKVHTLRGFVDGIDKSQAGAWRATIRIVNVAGIAPNDQPIFVRISLKQDEPPLPGTSVECSAIVRPPPGPVVPGAYDHSRRAWFQRLGGVGFALEPCKTIDLGSPGFALSSKLALAKWRAQASRHIVEAAPGPGAGFLAAVTTGDRAWLSPEDTQALQVAGLSHIISVSGLHVSLLAAFVFIALWKLLALMPALALHRDVRKIAAFVALCATGAYTVFTGAEAPAVRAFIMSAIALGAIILDRKAISMRGLAIAAIAVLMDLPESALEPGFQMSFLATAALVAMWEVWDRNQPEEARKSILRIVMLWVLAASATSLVAGLATAPVSAATFNRLSPYALPANLLVAPINDFIVAPAAILAATLSPLQLGDFFWKVAGWGLSINLKIAHMVAQLPGAGLHVAWVDTLPPIILIFAVLWLTLWRSWLRWLSVLPFFAGICLWIGSPKPVGWISPEGRAFLVTSANAEALLCRTSGGRFDAVRLMDHAGLIPAVRDRLLPAAENFNFRACRAGEGDWEGKFVETGRGRAILSLTFSGRSYAFGRGDIKDGALLMRNGWHIYLKPQPPRQGPWAKASTDDVGSISDGDGVRFGYEQ